MVASLPVPCQSGCKSLIQKRKAEIVKVSKHRDHHSGQILKVFNGTIKEKVYFKKKSALML